MVTATADMRVQNELQTHSVPLFATFVGLLFSVGTLVVYSFGVFFQPLQSEFGWARSEIAGALSISQLGLVVAGPIHGLLIDRFGARLLLPLSILGLGITMASLYWLSGSIYHLYGCFLLMTMLGATASPLGYSRIIVDRFDRHRGLALGIALSAVGVGAMLFPLSVQYLIDTLGWRSAYLAIGIAGLVPLLFCPLMFRPANDAHDSCSTSVQAKPAGPTVPAGKRTFALLGLIFTAMGTITVGVYAHFIPMLTDRGMGAEQAAMFTGLVGVAVIVSRGFIGWVVDNVHAPLVLAIIAGGIALACTLMNMQLGPLAIALVAVLLGLGLGAEMDLLSFLVSRYWSPQLFGTIYGPLFGIFSIGTAAGPLFIGMAYDHWGNYQVALVGAILIAALIVILCRLLPRYSTDESA
ncbi:MFS transporter [Pseudomaricurvus alkylphenolicus]|uniref:MFS transporter n=1 Tax=Pseudomaricurvus alkylphenolicus TaxID=1306991 RepID=UPI00141DB74B|nr:MFS transporter [Pseudomaricurvus alkylphenolicus]NIB43403.1 MFS transporter [Pseudomaricurvus alkylphenolicus]